jgi:hypothetical protein
MLAVPGAENVSHVCGVAAKQVFTVPREENITHIGGVALIDALPVPC